MVKKRGLGKPLDALLADVSTTHCPANDMDSSEKILCQLPIKQIQRGKYQPRREMDPLALEELSQSIRHQGIIQPIVVRPLSVPHTFEIIAGERRWRAAQLAGLTEIPALIRDIPDETAIALALIENIQRQDLNPIEEALALQQLIKECGLTHQQVADSIGKSRTTVTNLLRLLALPEEVQTMLMHGQLEMGHARTLITLPSTLQLHAAQLIHSRHLSVREAETLVRQLQENTPKNTKKSLLDDHLSHLQMRLSQQSGWNVRIQPSNKDKKTGKIVIHYGSEEEFNEIVEQFQSTLIA
jgi:ParB family transcriptional regulator, chromosome partitioning protein